MRLLPCDFRAVTNLDGQVKEREHHRQGAHNFADDSNCDLPDPSQAPLDKIDAPDFVSCLRIKTHQYILHAGHI